MLLREIFIGGARAPPAPPHATALLSFVLLILVKGSEFSEVAAVRPQ